MESALGVMETSEEVMVANPMDVVDELILAFTNDWTTVSFEAIETLSSLTSTGVCWQRTLVILNFVTEAFEKLGVSKAESILMSLVPEMEAEDEESLELVYFTWNIIQKCWKRRIASTKKVTRLQRKEDELIKLIFIWIQHILSYRLCPKSSLLPAYGSLFELMRIPAFHSTLAPILTSLSSESKQVTEHRINVMKGIVNDKQKTLVPAVENLIRTFHILNPGLMKRCWLSLTRVRKGGRDAATNRRAARLSKLLEAKFGALGSKNNCGDKECEDLLSILRFDAKLWWDVDKADPRQQKSSLGQSSTEPPSKMRKLCFLPAPDLPDVNEGFSLLKCSKVGDVFLNLAHLKDPAQPLSLLKNAGTFFLLGNPNNTLLQRKFSLSLYHYLHQEFFSGHNTGKELQRDYLLGQIDKLQDHLQQGIPVVGNFLTEFLMEWNGVDHFYTILPLICHIQITDFSELEACILLPITLHFDSFSPSQRLFFISVLHKLLLNWILLEYPRETRQQQHQRVFVMADREGSLRSPLECIEKLLSFFSDVIDETQTKLQPYASPEISPLPIVDRRRHLGMFLSQTTTFYLSICRALIETEVPLRPELPPNIFYSCLFDISPSLISRALEYLTIAKHELIPMCQRIYRVKYKPALSNSSRLLSRCALLREEAPLVRQQFGELETLNAITKDAQAILGLEKLYLKSGVSLFRCLWDVDHDDVSIHLKVATHPAFLHYTLKFSKEVANRQKLSIAHVHASLLDNGSDNYFAFVHNRLLEQLPRLSEFMATFERNKDRLKKNNRSHVSGTARSRVTSISSGIFSSPSNRIQISNQKC